MPAPPSPAPDEAPARPLRAALVLLAGLGLFVLATPGLDLQSGRTDYTRGEIWEIQEQYGVVGSTVARGSLAFNREVREPLLPTLQAFMRPIRGGQNWALFTRGRDRLRWFEVRVDDVAVHRSADSELDWRESTFRNRHVRPIVSMFVTRAPAENPYGDALVRWVVAMAREDFPDARRVTLLGFESGFPKGKEREIRKAESWAPRWEPNR